MQIVLLWPSVSRFQQNLDLKGCTPVIERFTLEVHIINLHTYTILGVTNNCAYRLLVNI